MTTSDNNLDPIIVDREELDSFLEEGMTILDGIVKVREQNIQRSLHLVPDKRRSAHTIFQSTMLKLLGDHAGVLVVNPSPDNEYEMALVNNLVQLVDPTYEMLMSGLYLGAAGLIRQSFEMNARLAEIQNNINWVDGKTPNVGHLPRGTARFYGELSAAAHFSRQGLAHLTSTELRPGTQAQSASPIVDQVPLLRLFDFHLAAMALTLLHQLKFFESAFGSDLEPYSKMAAAGDIVLQDAWLLEPGQAKS